MDFKPFHPPSRRLMGPGPADVHPRVLAALARPIIGHLDPAFIAMMDGLKSLLRYAFRTENALTMPVSAPGSAGMETCFVNLVEPGDKVVVCVNGVFGQRMIANVERIGGQAVAVEAPWGRAIDPQQLEATLKAHPDAVIVALVQAETSTGVVSDTRTLVDIAHRYECLTIVDAVTALGGSELSVDDWGIDAVYAGTQKCLSCTPGLSPISFNERALAKLKARQSRVQSWFLDLNLVLGYWGEGGRRAYHHTAPVNALYGLHEALLMLHEEGITNAWDRHRHHHEALRAGLEVLGLELIVPPAERLPQLNLVAIPPGVDDQQVRARLLNDFHLEIGAGLGDLAGKVWRIGQMGYSSRPENLVYCIAALGSVLTDAGLPERTGEALARMQQVLDTQVSRD